MIRLQIPGPATRDAPRFFVEHTKKSMAKKKRKTSWDNLTTVATVGNALPRRCGIATFTSDLTEAIAAAAPDLSVWSVAMNDRPEGYRYNPRVWFEVNEGRIGEYRLAADFLNMSNADVCCLQHEYGIFGGDCGEYILDFIRRLRMPVVTTCHTVLKEPNPKQLEVMRKLGEISDRLVVMAERAFDFLNDIYDIPKEKIALIGHGIPDVPFVDPNFYKDQFGVEGRKVILTFGLLSPNKGIENMVEALPAIVARHPDTTYIVLGATHPGVIAHAGEEYRIALKRRAKELGVADHIQWVNKFVEMDELVEYLGVADVYVTPYLNEAQITSGTLAYALGTGKATVSTPYWHAQELLADDRGILVPFKDPAALAAAINGLFENETERHAMRKRAYQYTRQFAWPDAAGQYLDLFEQVRADRTSHPKPFKGLRRRDSKREELVEIKLDHLRTLTDDTGIFSHAKATIPDRSHGYTTDDNTRALIAVLTAQSHIPTRRQYAPGLHTTEMISRFLSFIEHSYDERTGRFRNQLSFTRQWVEEPPSEDTHARAIWALGETVARATQRGHMAVAANLFQRSLDACQSMTTLHGIAYALIGIHAYLRRFSGDSHARRVRETLAQTLFKRFRDHGTNDWPWPSDELTYASAQLPHALLLSGRWMFSNEMIQTALRSLEWLHDVQTNEKGQFAPIGSDHPFRKGEPKPRFIQRPIEASASIDAFLEAYRVTTDHKWVDYAETALDWFLGDNDLHTPVYDATTGGCHDGLMPQGVNQNQGAEATIAWLLSLMSLYEHSLESDTGTSTRDEAKPDAPHEEAGQVDGAADVIEPVVLAEPVTPSVSNPLPRRTPPRAASQAK